MHRTQFGLLLERSTVTNETSVGASLPLLFALLNPLKDITPVICKYSSFAQSLGFLTPDEKLELVGVCDDRSLCLFYNREQELHSIWKLRSATDAEVNSVSATPRPLFCNRDMSDLSINSANAPTASPLASGSNRSAVNKQHSFTCSSPGSTSATAALASPNPSNSTLSSLRSVRLGASPNASTIRQISATGGSGNESLLGNQSAASISAARLAPGAYSILGNDLNDEVCEPIFPELCVEQLWVESISAAGPCATRVFITGDLIGAQYLTYLIPERQQLKLVRLEQSNSARKKLIFGTYSVLPARDAQPLPSLQMLLVLDPQGSLLLYSGIHRLSVVHLQHWPSVLGSLPATPAFRTGDSTLLHDTSQLAATGEAAAALAAPAFTSSRPASAIPNARLSICSVPFSPIVPDRVHTALKSKAGPDNTISQLTSRAAVVTALRDSVRDRITLQEAGGALHRVQVPPLANSSIVTLCVNALKNVLPREVGLKALGRWYTCRNSPGSTHLTVQQELRLFLRCVLTLCGYDLPGSNAHTTTSGTSATGSTTPLSSHTSKLISKCLSPSKRQRVLADDEHGSDEDWAALKAIIASGNFSDDLDYGFAVEKEIELDTPCVSSAALQRRIAAELKRINSIESSLLNSCLIGCSNECTTTAPPHHSSSAQPHATSTPGRSRATSTCGAQRLPVAGDALLFSYMPSVLFSLHLVLEEIKLNTLLLRETRSLLELLYLLAVDLRLGKYVDAYVEQLGGKRLKDERSVISSTDRKQLQFPNFVPSQPLCILSHLRELLDESPEENQIEPFPYIPETTVRIRQLVLVYRCFRSEAFAEKNCLHPVTKKKGVCFENFQFKQTDNEHERVVLCLDKLEVEKEHLHTIPSGVAIPLWDAIFACKHNPSGGWSHRAYELIGRDDLLALESGQTLLHLSRSSGVSDTIVVDRESNALRLRSNSPPPSHTMHVNNAMSNQRNQDLETFEPDADGFSQLNAPLLRLLFPEDQRVAEACSMLQSSRPAIVTVQQRPGVSDHEFIEEQERNLYNICIRTMALCIGRGMCTLRTYRPIIAETFPIPKLCLSGRAPRRHTSIELNHIEVPTNMNSWPSFHNGVAAGLRVASSAVDAIDSTWIIYNKPKIHLNQSADSQNEHAGFLLALGLNGHICRLSMMNIHDYLCMGNELTRVAVLLGLAAAKRGSMDLFAVKILSIHVEALLPPTSTELDVPPVAQVAAVLGIGLLYQASGQRHIAEVLLGEIGRPPGPEMEHYIDRESYALSAGLAFGLVTLGKGNQLVSLVSSAESVSMADQLCNYMIGGHKRPMSGLQKDKYRTPSYQIREGDYVNAHVTSPGATLALGMMFFNTGNETVAKWLSSPDTQHLLEGVRPDLLMLRTLAKGLVMWGQVRATKVWVDSHVPPIVAENALRRDGHLFNPRIDYETMSQAYCNIVSGACMAMALRYAGSADTDAFKTVMAYTKMFINLTNQQTVADQAGRFTIESCLNVLVLSLSIIMAGTGNLDVLRICRYLRSRINQVNVVLYGSHMATHMALGLLFLGGCRYTLSTSPAAVAAMICAFFPKFPIHSNDNRYHLQAFRHLYVLAAEPRLVIPRDIATGRFVYVHLKIKYSKAFDVNETVKQLKAPCFLPELHLIDELTISDDRYWKITFNKEQNWDMLRYFLSFSAKLCFLFCVCITAKMQIISVFTASSWPKKVFCL
jgi:anaphase-promoting complex subunit 1